MNFIEKYNNIKNIRCFPIFVSKEIYHPKSNNIFLIGDAFFTFPPTFAQGASQSIEAAFELYENLNNCTKQFFGPEQMLSFCIGHRFKKTDYFAQIERTQNIKKYKKIVFELFFTQRSQNSGFK